MGKVETFGPADLEDMLAHSSRVGGTESEWPAWPADDYAESPGVRAPVGPSSIAGQWGFATQIPVGTTTLGTSAFSLVGPSRAFDQDTEVTVYFQANTVPQNSAGNATIIAKVTWALGGATFTRYLLVSSGGLRKMRMVARYVAVSYAVFSFASATTTLGKVTAAIAPGRYLGADEYAWSLMGVLGGSADHVQASPTGVTVPAVLGQLMVMMTTAQAPGTLLYPLVFDLGQSTAPAANAVPWLVLAPVSQAGQYSTFEDEAAPGANAFTSGCLVALSTTPTAYTAPTAGNTIVVQGKWGQ